MRKTEKIILIVIFIGAIIFLIAGINWLRWAIPAYHESQILKESGANCLTPCDFWHFFFWPIVFITSAILLMIFGIFIYMMLRKKEG